MSFVNAAAVRGLHRVTKSGCISRSTLQAELVVMVPILKTVLPRLHRLVLFALCVLLRGGPLRSSRRFERLNNGLSLLRR